MMQNRTWSRLRNAIDWPILARDLLTVVVTAFAMAGLMLMAAGWLL